MITNIPTYSMKGIKIEKKNFPLITIFLAGFLSLLLTDFWLAMILFITGYYCSIPIALIEKRKIKSKVIECKTIRENNGVACSSRNSNLNKNQIKIASNIYYYLCKLKKKIKKDYSLFNINKIKQDLIDLGVSKIDYLENYDIKDFRKIKKQNKKSNLFIAYFIKNIRLIDNI